MKKLILLNIFLLSPYSSAQQLELLKPETDVFNSIPLSDIQEQPLLISKELPPSLLPTKHILEYEQDIEKFIYEKNWQSLQNALVEYADIPNHNVTLLNFAQAYLYRGQNRPEKSLKLYEDILYQNPDYIFVRLAYAEALFEAKQYKNAKQQFEQLDISQLLEPTARSVQLYLEQIQLLEKAQWSVGLNYLDNDNINQASSNPTLKLNGRVFYKSDNSLPKQSQGLSYEFGVSKSTNLSNHWHLLASVYADGVYYFKYHDYDEQSIMANVALQNKTSNNTWQIMPFVQYSRYDDSSYNHSYGVQFGQIHQINNVLQSRLSHTIRQVNYADYVEFDGLRQNSQIALVFKKSNYSLFTGLNYNTEQPQDKEYHAYKSGINLGMEYRWQQKIGMQTRFSMFNRQFKQPHSLANIVRHDKEYTYQVSFFSPKIRYKQWVPMINWLKQDIKSNIPDLYDSYKQQVYISLYREF